MIDSPVATHHFTLTAPPAPQLPVVVEPATPRIVAELAAIPEINREFAEHFQRVTKDKAGFNESWFQSWFKQGELTTVAAIAGAVAGGAAAGVIAYHSHLSGWAAAAVVISGIVLPPVGAVVAKLVVGPQAKKLATQRIPAESFAPMLERFDAAEGVTKVQIGNTLTRWLEQLSGYASLQPAAHLALERAQRETQALPREDVRRTQALTHIGTFLRSSKEVAGEDIKQIAKAVGEVPAGERDALIDTVATTLGASGRPLSYAAEVELHRLLTIPAKAEWDGVAER